MAVIQWIKLSVGMFEDEKIKLIEAMPEYDTMLIIWIKLLIWAGKNNDQGNINLSGITLSDEVMASILGRPINTVRDALKCFVKLKMLEIVDDNTLFISNWEKHQNLEGMERIKESNRLRQQEHRLKLTQGNQVLIRDQFTCQYCGDEANGVDHLIPTSKGGDIDDPLNQVACCQRCNKLKMIQPVEYFLNNIITFGGFVLRKDLIKTNSALSNVVTFDEEQQIYTVCHTVSHVTDCDRHAIEVEVEVEVDKNKNKNKNNTTAAAVPIKDLFYSFKGLPKYTGVDFENEFMKFHEFWYEGRKDPPGNRKLACHNWLDKAVDIMLKGGTHGTVQRNPGKGKRRQLPSQYISPEEADRRRAAARQGSQ